MEDQNILEMLKQSAVKQRTFADRLRDERSQRKNVVGQFIQQTTPQESFTSNGVPLAPSQVFSSRDALLRSVEGAMSPYNPELEMKARDSEAGILSELYKLSKESGMAGVGIDPETGEIDYSNVTGDDALSIVNKTGRRLLSGGLNEKKAQAEAILSYGGVDKYLQKAPLSDIYSLPVFKKDAEASENGFELLRRVNAAQAYFSPNAVADFLGEGNITGPIAGRKGFLRGKAQREGQAVLGELSSEKINQLSGAAVSPQEFERLKTFIPTATMQENEVATQLDKLAKAVQMNLKVREDAIRSGINTAEYWESNKNKYLSQYGFSPTQELKTSSGNKYTIVEE